MPVEDKYRLRKCRVRQAAGTGQRKLVEPLALYAYERDRQAQCLRKMLYHGMPLEYLLDGCLSDEVGIADQASYLQSRTRLNFGDRVADAG